MSKEILAQVNDRSELVRMVLSIPAPSYMKITDKVGNISMRYQSKHIYTYCGNEEIDEI